MIDLASNVTVLVIGDIMLDRYWWGDVNRISPEAPVPVVRLRESTFVPGGAANVAANVASLGGDAILIGCHGTDDEARSLRSALERSNVRVDHLLEIEGRPTTVKTRVIAHGQQVVRVDNETLKPVDDASCERLIRIIQSNIDAADSVLLSDYAKGTLTGRLLAETIRLAKGRGKPVIVDPKGKDYSKYSGVTLLTPNRGEAAEACNLYPHDADLIERAGGQLLQQYDVGAVLITQGEDGMTLFTRDAGATHFAAAAREVYDVTGAGDTVAAALAIAIGRGVPMTEAARFANIAAGIAVEHVGTTVVRSEMVRERIVQDDRSAAAI